MVDPHSSAKLKSRALILFAAGMVLIVIASVTTFGAFYVHDYYRYARWKRDAEKIKVGNSMVDVKAIMGSPLEHDKKGYYREGLPFGWNNPEIFVYGRRFKALSTIFSTESGFTLPIDVRMFSVSPSDIVVEFDEDDHVKGVYVKGSENKWE